MERTSGVPCFSGVRILWTVLTASSRILEASTDLKNRLAPLLDKSRISSRVSGRETSSPTSAWSGLLSAGLGELDPRRGGKAGISRRYAKSMVARRRKLRSRSYLQRRSWSRKAPGHVSYSVQHWSTVAPCVGATSITGRMPGALILYPCCFFRRAAGVLPAAQRNVQTTGLTNVH
jgi:hypothetical protein